MHFLDLLWSIHVFDHNRKLGLGGSESWRSWRTTWNLGRSPRRGIRLKCRCRDSKCRRSLCTGVRIRVLGYCGNTARWFWFFYHTLAPHFTHNICGWWHWPSKPRTPPFLRNRENSPAATGQLSIRSSWRMWAKPRSSGRRRPYATELR